MTRGAKFSFCICLVVRPDETQIYNIFSFLDQMEFKEEGVSNNINGSERHNH